MHGNVYNASFGVGMDEFCLDVKLRSRCREWKQFRISCMFTDVNTSSKFSLECCTERKEQGMHDSSLARLCYGCEDDVVG
jgi:hypothetical protein